MSASLYLLHFSEPLGDPERPRMSARHYLGYTRGSVRQRVELHRLGQGSAITRAAVGRGIALTLVWRGDGTRTDERRRKRNGHFERLCPVCAAR